MTDPVSDPASEAAPEAPRPRRGILTSTIGGTCYLALVAVSALAIAVVVWGDWRVGVRLLGACLTVAGGLRLVLPEREAGMLAVRPRPLDVALLVGVGVTLWWLAGSIPDQRS